MDARKMQGAFYAALGLLSVGLLGAGLAAAGAVGLAFGLFAALTLGGALVCLWERSVVRSAFSLMGTFIGIAGLFLLLESDFLAMAQILIYVGGILALLLFGVMLSPPDLDERRLTRVLPGLGIIGAATAALGLAVARNVHWAEAAGTPTGAKPEPFGNAERIGVGFLAMDQYVVAFELAAVVLTVTLVAAVYIARRRRADIEPLGESVGEQH